jgi:hypothetical protein
MKRRNINSNLDDISKIRYCVRFSDDILEHINNLDSKILPNEWNILYKHKFKLHGKSLHRLNIIFKSLYGNKGEYNYLLNQISVNLNIMNNSNNNELRDTLRHEYLHFLDFICIGKHKLNRNKIESEIKEKEVINNLHEDCVKNKSKLSKIYIRQEIKKIKKSLCYDYIGYNNSKNELNVRILVILSNVANIRNYMLDDLNEYVFKELKNDINLDYLHDESISFIKNKIKNIYFLSNKRHF